MSNHTAAPWVATTRVSDCGHLCAYIEAAPSDGAYRGSIAYVQSAEHIDGIGHAEAKANVALIVQAPALLQALRWMVALLPDPATDDDKARRDLVICAKQVIDAATGEQSEQA